MKEWRLDELSHAGQEHLDETYVAIDLGAGLGTFAIAVAPRCREVIAVDASPAMTALLREQVEQLELDNVTVIDGGFLSYEHRGDPVDATNELDLAVRRGGGSCGRVDG
jgi:methylase of polypeptide subunit release factors